MSTTTKINHADLTLYSPELPFSEITDADERAGCLDEYRRHGSMEAFLVNPNDYSQDEDGDDVDEDGNVVIIGELGPTVEQIDWTGFRAVGDETAIEWAVDRLSAVTMRDGGYAYRDNAMDAWYLASREAMLVLYDMAHVADEYERENAYSLWCSAVVYGADGKLVCTGEQIEPGTAAHAELVDRGYIDADTDDDDEDRDEELATA